MTAPVPGPSGRRESRAPVVGRAGGPEGSGRLAFGQEGWRLARERSQGLLPRQVRPRALGLTWIVLAAVVLALTGVAVLIARAL